MYLKKLEIVGFKSFYDKTTLHFEPGMTAVVGPNGCGKSNIFDSIRWVLGEQSVKALRGSDMQDVIFNGTEKKEPLGMAEVTLSFDNKNRFFPMENEEVAISRRIFRSGESEYLLNKAPVRLKDILDLLAGTGIGAESYSLVQQGKIDLVLSAKPEERRMVFDEAAGITKYKSQKKEALRRLEETEQNLLRVNDIVAEVKRQIGSLERQANKARRYKDAFEELKAKELNFALLQKKGLGEEREGLIKNLRELEENAAKMLEEITHKEGGILAHQNEIKNIEENISLAKRQILNLNNSLERKKERIALNNARAQELAGDKQYLDAQVSQGLQRLNSHSEELNSLKNGYEAARQATQEKASSLKENEAELEKVNSAVKSSLENISAAKKELLELAAKSSHSNNELNDAYSKEQIYAARQKRLEIEKAKLNEEIASVQANLSEIDAELALIQADFDRLSLDTGETQGRIQQEKKSLDEITLEIGRLEKLLFSMQSQKEFLEKLKNKYEDIGESMGAVIYLDRSPSEKISGLVIKVKDASSAQEDASGSVIKLTGEAKPIDLNADRVAAQINQTQAEIESCHQQKSAKESLVSQLSAKMQGIQEELRQKEIALINKKASRQAVAEQAEKINREADVINLELSDNQEEISGVQARLASVKETLGILKQQEEQLLELTAREQSNITLNNSRKEEVLVTIATIRAELQSLEVKLSEEEKILQNHQNSYNQLEKEISQLRERLGEIQTREESLRAENKEMEGAIQQDTLNAQIEEDLLKENESRHSQMSLAISDVVAEIDKSRKEYEGIKNSLHALEIKGKDLEFKYLGIRERLLQAYKADLDLMEAAQDSPAQDIPALQEEIRLIREKVDAFGSVNLVAIEEYDELKKRYDFLAQQQNDLVLAKESLHEAILKINRTTRKMFVETFARIQEEFRACFRLLFNGGDAQLFLIDEQDPLESGIEIICRPPGKKLQNVLLLSGGEKSMSAIALIFAIFKIKPAPFCVLDEIDAALDEANVERLGRMLQEFTKTSQFIMITHNKRTISNADIMYGITMEEQGLSKIVSVKFSQNAKEKVEAAVTQTAA